jgi:hypothetical protein
MITARISTPSQLAGAVPAGAARLVKVVFVHRMLDW